MIKYITNSWNFPKLRIQKKASWYMKYESTPDNTYVSALFLGSGEFWSSNRNGDFFSEKTLMDHYKSFLNAKHYHQHVNDDPTNSFGDVADVFYNPEMHRVEGIIRIINKLSPETITRIDKGENIPLSMACRVPYDICSICGNKAYKTENYCDHLRYHMNDILEDGRKIYAINPDPDFFDISEVVIGADPTACIFKKIASKNDFSIDKFAMDDKIAILDKMSEIEKQIVGIIDSKNPTVQFLHKGIGKQKIKNVGKKTATLIRPLDVGISGRCMIYDALKKQGFYKVELDNDGDNPKDRDLTIQADRGLLKISSIYNTNINSLAKIAAINIELLSNNPDLLNNNLALQSSIVQNCLKGK